MDLPTELPYIRVNRDIFAQIDALDSVHEVMADYWSAVSHRGCCQVDGTWRALFNSAVAEIAGNIIRHAYPDHKSGETFNITLQCFHDRVEAIMLDHGLPFDFTPPSRKPDMRDAIFDLDLDHGWGLPISYAATDSLEYERLPGGYNRWQMGKLLPDSMPS